MEREEEIIKIAKKIQFQINKLKKLNCSIDLMYNTIGVFDNEIDTTKISGHIDHANQVVFTFDTAR